MRVAVTEPEPAIAACMATSRATGERRVRYWRVCAPTIATEAATVKAATKINRLVIDQNNTSSTDWLGASAN